MHNKWLTCLKTYVLGGPVYKTVDLAIKEGLTAILSIDAFTDVHLSSLRSMTRINPMPASCKLDVEIERRRGAAVIIIPRVDAAASL